MDPTDSNEDNPDISLRVVTTGRAKTLDLGIAWDNDIREGQVVEFEANAMKLGDDDNPHLFEL